MIDRQKINRQMKKQINRQINRQIDKQINRQIVDNITVKLLFELQNILDLIPEIRLKFAEKSPSCRILFPHYLQINSRNNLQTQGQIEQIQEQCKKNVDKENMDSSPMYFVHTPKNLKKESAFIF